MHGGIWEGSVREERVKLDSEDGWDLWKGRNWEPVSESGKGSMCTGNTE